MRTDWTLSGWQSYLDEMYGEVNNQRDPLATFARVTEMATGFSRGVRENDDQLLRIFAPRFFAWLLGLASQLDVNVEEAVWRNYPGVCAYCRESQDCTCRLEGGEKERITEPSEISKLQEQHTKPGTLLEWVGMFDDIYCRVNENTGKDKMLGHYMEELGELSEMIRHFKYARQNGADIFLSEHQARTMMEQELSDLFAWYCGLLSLTNTELDANIKRIYDPLCPVCNSKPCECDPNYVHDEIRLGKHADY